MSVDGMGVCVEVRWAQGAMEREGERRDEAGGKDLKGRLHYCMRGRVAEVAE